MLLPFQELKKREFTLKNIYVFHQNPSYRRLDPKPKGRKANGFLYILQGEGRYTFQNGSFLLSPGDIVYLPSGSKHTFEVLSEKIDFYRIDFDLFIDGELTFFSQEPKKMLGSTDRDLVEAIYELAQNYEFDNDTVSKTALLCTIFRSLGKEGAGKNAAKIAPAIHYLLEHLTEKISCTHLASLCFLSTAQFYSLFQEEYHMAPLEYRSQLLSHKAAYLLKTGSFSVTEVSEMMGFESVSYFSRFFKKQHGLSPAAYIKKQSS